MTSPCSSIDSQELISLYYQTFNKGDRPALLRLLHPNIVHDINQSTSDTGIDAFQLFLQRMDRCYTEQVEHLVVMASEDGTRASSEFFIQGTYIATDDGLPPAKGQTYHLRVGAFFEIRDGLIARVTNYYNLTDWLKQVGAA